MEPLQTPIVPVKELLERYSFACQLRQPVNWPRIEECLQRWLAVMEIDAAPVLRIEEVQAYTRALRSADAAYHASYSRMTNSLTGSWAAQATRVALTGTNSELECKLIMHSNSAGAARRALYKSVSGPANTACAYRFEPHSPGQMNPHWMAIKAVGASGFRDADQFLRWYPLFEAFEAGAFCFFFTDRGVEVCPMPSVVKVDDQNRLHSDSGPAFVWLVSVRDFYWHGVRVEPRVVENPGSITVEEIEAEPHRGVRKMKMERWAQVHPESKLSGITEATGEELKERYLRACELKQTVNWNKIEGYFRRWAAAFEIEVSAIVRVETLEQLKTASLAAWDMWDANRNCSNVTKVIAKRKSEAFVQTWDMIATNAEHRIMVMQRMLSPEGVTSDANRLMWAEWAEESRMQAAFARSKIASSPASLANLARMAKVEPIVRAASRTWITQVELNGKTSTDGSIIRDVSYNCIAALEALEKGYHDTKFSSYYLLLKAFEAGAFCFFITRDSIHVCPIPTGAKLDDRGRLHSDSGPAFEWLDDIRQYYWHGVQVMPYVVENPERITVADIEAESNAEVRRVKIERFGQFRYLIDSGAQEVHRDDYGILFRKDIPGDEPLVMVMVVNATAEPDGSFRDYFLRVPPSMRTAREAVAWTFGKTENDYGPGKET